jgi:predicted nucleic acid-binding protein
MYLDSGIIVKLLIREPDSDYFDSTLSGEVLDSSELCLTEVFSALLAKEAAGAIKKAERQEAWRKFEEMIEEEIIRLLPLDRRVLDRAAGLLNACYPHNRLRTLDALHVATCALHHCDTLCATDRRMREAGAQIGIPLHPPEP